MLSFEELERLFLTHIGAEQLAAVRSRMKLARTRPDFDAIPPRVLIILFSSRSGSTYSARLLANTPYFKRIREQFNAATLAHEREHLGLGDDMAAVRLATKRDSTGMAFGAKCGVPGMIGALYTGFLSSALDRTRFITLRRRDSVAQAVSLAKARLTGQYHSPQNVQHRAAASDYDYNIIARSLGEINLANGRLQALANALPNANLLIDYEDVCADPQAFVDIALDHADLPRVRLPSTEVGLKALRDEVSDEWQQRFETDMAGRRQHYLHTTRRLPARLAAKFERRCLPASISAAVDRWGKPTRRKLLRGVARRSSRQLVKRVCTEIPIETIGGFAAPDHLLCIFATPHSGAEQAAVLLGHTQHFSAVTEAFAPQPLMAMRAYSEEGCWHKAAQLAIDTQGTSEAFAMKGGFELLAGTAHIGLLHEIIGRLTFVRLRRRDVGWQAVSQYVRGLKHEGAELLYDARQIAAIAQRIATREEQMDHFLTDRRYAARTIWFEDERTDPRAFAAKLCSAAGLSDPVIELSNARLTAKLDDSDPRIDEWAARYRAGR